MSPSRARSIRPGRRARARDAVADLAGHVRLVVLDVDGVMTDGGIFLGDARGHRVEFKQYDIQDGLGIRMLQRAEIRVAFITGRVSDSVSLRARELGVGDVVQDEHARKLPALRALCEASGIALAEVAFVGDDLPDLGAMRAVGLPVAVANATAEVLAVAKHTLTRGGGHGAVREFAEWLLRARGQWDALVEWYVKSREDAAP